MEILQCGCEFLMPFHVALAIAPDMPMPLFFGTDVPRGFFLLRFRISAPSHTYAYKHAILENIVQSNTSSTHRMIDRFFQPIAK
ncbi:hypothetical protein NX80_016090 [Xanthomonas vasicola pv. arecae]|nr:hypothetical protein NX80_016090 [Xanthomonas vasicola pv. arecae]KFA36982.1 hypothetical protein KWI_0107500 [Xanthomonas vasicola pv. vasculorum NCPPB 206]